MERLCTDPTVISMKDFWLCDATKLRTKNPSIRSMFPNSKVTRAFYAETLSSVRFLIVTSPLL